MEEGKGERYLASGRQFGNALLGVRHQEEEEDITLVFFNIKPAVIYNIIYYAFICFCVVAVLFYIFAFTCFETALKQRVVKPSSHSCVS